MPSSDDRRRFLTQGAALTAGLFAGHASSRTSDAGQDAAAGTHAEHAGEASEFPRMHPGLGGEIGSPSDRGRLTPGLRSVDEPPAPVTLPDMQKLPWKMVNGVKEFHLRATPARRELLPGIWMDAYGYNDLFPGPCIEVNQGDRIRIVLKNELPEATTLHCHGLELPVSMDGIPGVTQDYVKPGESFPYEFTLHQEGTYFYHPHVAMQEAVGMAGALIIHPKKTHSPVVDRDFVMLAQQFSILPNATIPNSNAMDWNFLTFNGRSGPYTTPLVCRLGERVRLRFINFSTLHQHPMHLHGHTFWVTGTEGGRIPDSSWIPGNTVVVGVAQCRDVEFIANNPGDWVMHCHMFHHMMNHMVSQVGPIIRDPDDSGFRVPGYPQIMKGMSNMKMVGMDHGKGKYGTTKQEAGKPGDQMHHLDAASKQTSYEGFRTGRDSKLADDYQMTMTMQEMNKIKQRRETAGMRKDWFKGVHGLFTVVRVLPPDLYDLVMNTDQPVPDNSSTPLHPHG